MKNDHLKRTSLPVTLTIEDEEGTEGWPYPAIVPVVFIKSDRGLEGECSFGAYPVLREFLYEFGRAPFTKKALSELNRRLAPYLESVGCRRFGGIYRYYRSFVLWDREKLNRSVIRPDSALLTAALARKIRINHSDFDPGELLSSSLPAYVTVKDGELLSLCTINPASEGQRLLELTVYTRPGHRGQGYGASNAAALTDRLLSRGKGAVYVTSCRNRPSLRLVKRLGFESESRFYAVDAYRLEDPPDVRPDE